MIRVCVCVCVHTHIRCVNRAARAWLLARAANVQFTYSTWSICVYRYRVVQTRGIQSRQPNSDTRDIDLSEVLRPKRCRMAEHKGQCILMCCCGRNTPKEPSSQEKDECPVG